MLSTGQYHHHCISIITMSPKQKKPVRVNRKVTISLSMRQRKTSDNVNNGAKYNPLKEISPVVIFQVRECLLALNRSPTPLLKDCQFELTILSFPCFRDVNNHEKYIAGHNFLFKFYFFFSHFHHACTQQKKVKVFNKKPCIGMGNDSIILPNH